MLALFLIALIPPPAGASNGRLAELRAGLPPQCTEAFSSLVSRQLKCGQLWFRPQHMIPDYDQLQSKGLASAQIPRLPPQLKFRVRELEGSSTEGLLNINNGRYRYDEIAVGQVFESRFGDVTVVSKDPRTRSVRIRENDVENVVTSMTSTYPCYGRCFQIDIPLGKRLHSIKVNFTEIPDEDIQPLLDKLKRQIAFIPAQHIGALSSVNFRNSRSTDLPQRYASGPEIYVNFTPEKGNTIGEYEDDENTLLHEFGHVLAYRLSRDSIPPDWESVMLKDGNLVTRYSGAGEANSRRQEDFADFMVVYLKTDGGRLFSRLRFEFPTRFAYLDALFQKK